MRNGHIQSNHYKVRRCIQKQKATTDCSIYCVFCGGPLEPCVTLPSASLLRSKPTCTDTLRTSNVFPVPILQYSVRYAILRSGAPPLSHEAKPLEWRSQGHSSILPSCRTVVQLAILAVDTSNALRQFLMPEEREMVILLVTVLGAWFAREAMMGLIIDVIWRYVPGFWIFLDI
ncbi:hypothetical protein F5884DRAFT_807606 [Xylogone sp. PMI_703]|nr:hypothetical protein F5884DRAFT_807606 [Xylogone sp. PMI_703]